MSNVLTISSANLDTIEQNMLSLNRNINSVTNDIVGINGKINSFNNEVSEVKNTVVSLEQEIRDFMFELKGSNNVSTAQNDLLIKQNEFNKKFHDYESIREKTKNFINSINRDQISKNNVFKCANDFVNFPANFYLPYIVKAICNWFENSEIKAKQNLNKAYGINPSKTSLFMAIFTLKIDRKKASLAWVKNYLKLQSPVSINSDFILLLDTIASTGFDDAINSEIIKCINKWSETIPYEKDIYNNCLQRWKNFFYVSVEIKNDYELLPLYINNYEEILNQIKKIRSYETVFQKFDKLFENKDNITYNENTLDKLIYSYENEELSLRKSILKDECIINNKGNYSKSEEEYKAKESTLVSNNDLYTLLTDALIYDNQLSSQTKKLIVSLIKKPILEALENNIKNEKLNNHSTIKIDDIEYQTTNGSNEKLLIDNFNYNIQKKIDNILLNYSYIDFKTIISVVIMIGGIVLLFYNVYFGIICSIGGLILLIYFLYEISKERDIITKKELERYQGKKEILKDVISEIVDVSFEIEDSHKNYNQIVDLINSFNSNDYTKRSDINE